MGSWNLDLSRYKALVFNQSGKETMKRKLLLLLTCLISCETKPQNVNPCIALKLPLCKVKQDFADQHGIRQNAPAAPVAPVQTPSFSPTVPPRRSQSSFNRERDTLIVTPSETISQGNQLQKPARPPLRSTLLDRLRSQTQNRGASTNNNDACKGLRFCVLSNPNGSSNRRVTTTTTTEDPLIEQLLHSAGFGSSGASLINLVLNGELDEAKQLIADGADVNSADQHGNSVLHIAAQNGRAGIIEDLILNGADVNKGNNHKNTAIHLAAQNGWTDVAGHLLRAKKLDVNFKDLHANTALHLAAQNGQIGVTEKLIEAGANVNSANAHKLTPLHLAAQNGHNELTKILVRSGADMDYQDLIGNTPLHTAVHNTHMEIAKYLVASGANENKKNLSGLTPFQLG